MLLHVVVGGEKFVGSFRGSYNVYVSSDYVSMATYLGSGSGVLARTYLVSKKLHVR